MSSLPAYLSTIQMLDFIDLALKEDIGLGDHSSLASLDSDTKGEAKIIAKESGILAGIRVAEEVFNRVDADLDLALAYDDGGSCKPGDVILTVSGKARSILSAERLVLNFLQRMSGIATKTNRLCKLIDGTGAQLLDTRKTTPNFRAFEKWAVRIGGGRNHRFALHDMIMLKDNHNDFASGIINAVRRTKDYLKKNNLDLKIEVETRSLQEVREAIDAEVDIILLDNMGPTLLNTAVKMIDGRCKSEASGGITEQNIVEIAETGVDYISVGALTHNYKSLDLSMKASIG